MQVVSYEIYKVNDQLSFIISGEKVIVKTPHQTNLIVYINGNYKKRWERLHNKIRKGEFNSISDLISYNSPRIAGITQIQGLILIPTRLERYVNI